MLTKIIESIGLTRRQVFIANVLKCRPPGNRTPLPDEVLNCEPYLQKQIEWIRPQILCALGAVAAQALSLGAEGIGLCRTEHMFLDPERLPAVRQMLLNAPLSRSRRNR